MDTLTDQLQDLTFEYLKESDLWDLVDSNCEIDSMAERLAAKLEKEIERFIEAEIVERTEVPA